MIETLGPGPRRSTNRAFGESLRVPALGIVRDEENVDAAAIFGVGRGVSGALVYGVDLHATHHFLQYRGAMGCREKLVEHEELQAQQSDPRAVGDPNGDEVSERHDI